MTELSSIHPNDLLEAIETTDQFLELAYEKEQDCLRRIFLRMCIVKGLIGANFKEHVKRLDFPDDKNYVEWYYQVGKKQSYLLMSRRIFARVKDGIPEFGMDINFNDELVTNNEL